MSETDYRAIAKECLLMASIEEADRDKPLWITLAQSWHRLAEQSSQRNNELAEREPLPTAQHDPPDDSLG